MLIRWILLQCWLVGLVASQRPKVPLFSSGRWIVDRDGARVKLRCINWAAHMEVNVPEGLHKQPVEYVADWIARHGFNCVRLTYSVDHALDPYVLAEDGFRAGARAAKVDEAGLMDLYRRAMTKNPFLEGATQRDVFSWVIRVLWERNIMTVLDNHVSRASWCCNLDDGNGWPSNARFFWSANSRYFDERKWLDGLASMSAWAASQPGVVGMGIRNEMRATWTQIPFAPADWYGIVTRASLAVHTANRDLLVIVGGLNSATDLTPTRTRPLDVSGWAGKHVWEAHDYVFTVTTPDVGGCDVHQAQYGLLYGFVLEQGRPQTGPLFMSEFGVAMTGGPNSGLSDDNYAFLTCFVDWIERNDADWALWAVQGSYYVRDGQLDQNENWGALDYNWKGWRNPAFKGLLGRMFQVRQGP